MTPELATVIKHYAQQGHSYAAVTYLLDWPCVAEMEELCEEHGLAKHFKPRTEPTGYMRTIEAVNERNAFEYQGIRDTLSGHCRRLGISESTARKRKSRRPDDLDYVFSSSSHNDMPGAGRVHPWRSQG